MNKNNKRIAVVGAGLAGLTAAYTLQKEGYLVDVYEASKRVGGRVLTASVLNKKNEYSIAELGAHNIADGLKCTNINVLLSELGLKKQSSFLGSYGNYFDGTNMHSTKDLIPKIEKNSDALAQKLEQIGRRCRTMQDVLDELFPQPCAAKNYISSVFNGYEGMPPEKLSVDHNMEILFYVLSEGLPKAIVGNSIDEDIEFVFVEGGNGNLPLTLASRIAKPITFNKALASLQLHSNTTVLLNFTDGDSAAYDKVLLAIPAPIYHDVSFDSTPISSEQLSAIRRIEYGDIGKFFIPVPEHPSLKKFLTTSFMTTFLNNDDQLLTAYLWHGEKIATDKVGIFAQTLATCKQGFDSVEFDETQPVFAENNKQFQCYQKPIAKSWKADQFIKGAYSASVTSLNELFHQLVEHKGTIIKKMFTPINDTIYFAGEHTTILNELGTMEAAVESGIRMSKAISEQLKQETASASSSEPFDS